MGRPALYIKGEKCPRGHMLNDKTLAVRKRKVMTGGNYCRLCHAAWHRSRFLQKKLYLACSANGG